MFNYITATALGTQKIMKRQKCPRDLGRSPEEKLKEHSEAIYRVPLMLSLNIGRGPLHDVTHQI